MADIVKIDPLKADFRNFLFLIWQHLRLPEPTEVQYDIASYLQHGPKRLVIEAFRGVGKSWITSAYVCWALYCDPQTKILVVSASKERADAFSTFTKRLIYEVPFLQHLSPRGDQRSSNVAFDVGPSDASHAPSVKSVGITGQMTGSRANLIVADDIETPKNSMTSPMREKLAEAIKEFDAVLSPGGRIVYLGTPQTEESIYNVLPQRGYEIRIWPARYPDKPEKYEGKLAPFIIDRLDSHQAGTSTDPKRFSDLDLVEREASYGRSGFALQFMLDTTLSDADRHPLKLSDLIVMSLNPEIAPVKVVYASSKEQIIDLPAVGFTGDRYHSPMWVHKDWVEYDGSVMAIDPSGRGSDETSYAVVKMLNGQLYLTAAGGLKGGYDLPTLETLSKIARDQKVNHILIETNFGDGMFTQLFTPVLIKFHPCTTEEIRHSTQKEKRIIDTLEPVLNQHRLVVDDKLILRDYKETDDQKFQLFYQLTRITKDRGSLAKDDRLDALAMAVAYWVEHMSKDTDSVIEEYRESLLQQELERFAEHVFGHRPSPSNWHGA